MTADRRANPRVPLILAVQHSGSESVLDFTENLSARGMFIRTERSFRIGDRVTLVVSFPQLLEPVELQVEVVRERAATPVEPGGVAVRVPADRAQDLERLAEVARKIGAPQGPEPSVRVLLAEDNALVASMYAAALRRLSGANGLPTLGIEVAADGAAAFDRLLRTPPVDVVVTDVFMPVLSGISLVERIRAEPALVDIPVVVITSAGDRERELLASFGVTVFLRKPVSYLDVAGAIRTLLESGTALRSRPSPGRGTPIPVGGGGLGLTSGIGVGMNPTDARPASRR